LAGLAAVLATIGSLGTLVDAASLIFLITFAIVNYISYQQKVKYRIISLMGSIACLIAILLSSYEQFRNNPIPITIILVIIFFALIGRPYILKKMKSQ
jgi:hypothetical protein